MADDVAVSAQEQSDIDLLHKMGYAQELKRGMGSFSNFAVSFSIISILTGGITTYYLGMDAGGPLVITIGTHAVRRHGHGGNLFGVPDGRRSVLVVRTTREQEQGGVVVVVWLVQPGRPDCGHGLD